MFTLRYIFFLTVCSFLVLFTSCEKDPAFNTSSSAKLNFSADTLKFDTVFTNIGSSTYKLMVYNKYDKSLKISSLRLMGGDKSYFKLNVDGLSVNEATDIEILPKDSLYIFVQVLINPLNQNNPVSILDSIQFQVNGSIQQVKLQAIGQDVHFFNNKTIGDAEWLADKPYLIYNDLVIDSGKTLNIHPGVRIFMHSNASIVSYGTLKAMGTKDKSIVIQGDRLERTYQNFASQWGTIFLLAPGKDNEIHNTLIKNAVTGIQIGQAVNEKSTNLTITNSRIVNSGNSGICAYRATIQAENVIIANSGYYLVAAFLGGDYLFTHCTLYNMGVLFTKTTSSSLYLSETKSFQEGNAVYNLKGKINSFTFRNSIIWGNNQDEFEAYSSDKSDVNYFFDHCLLRSTVSQSSEAHFSQMTKWTYGDPLLMLTHQTTDTLAIERYNFGLDTLSVAKDKGDIRFSAEVPFDFFGKSRYQNDKAPDLGAIERYEK